MPHFKIHPRDIFFILKEQLDYGRLCALDRYRGLNEKTLDLLVNEAIGFARGMVAPLNEIGEEKGPAFDDGRVVCPAAFKEAFKKYGEDGWIAAARGQGYGGGGFPHMLRIVINDFMYGACQSFNMAPSLTHGAAHLIETFGSDQLKDIYLAKMYAGKWSGTMCLTEPDAGSNLAALKTSASPAGDGYKIKGNKIFISWGDHDLTDNIIHLTLARIDGAPEGVKGISLFVVPKHRVDSGGRLGNFNDVQCTGMERKLGLHGSPTCALTFGANDACIGYLCGEPNKGLAHMFQMMNAARINTGVSGMTLASTAYRNAVEYTRNRVQGYDAAGLREDAVPIVEHPDVRRMLLWMKAMVDGMRSMIYTGAFWQDLSMELSEGEKKVHYGHLLDFITPIIKAYCSDMGFRVCETAIQCLGGYGYCKDYPLEQYLRDSKIMSLYEGANGIQAIDLMGRKMTVNEGACLLAFKKELKSFCKAHSGHPGLGSRVQSLSSAAQNLFDTSDQMIKLMHDDRRQWASYTYPALKAFGEVFMAWRLLDMALVAWDRSRGTGPVADYCRAKVYQCTYFLDTTLPHTNATLNSCLRSGREIIETAIKAF